MSPSASVLARKVKLPSAPVIVQRLHDLINKETTGARDIGRLIAADQALTARVLRVVNSPFYGFSKKITAVPDAIKIMGIKAIHRLVLAASVMESFGDEIDRTINAKSFWLHSLGTGLVAKHLIRTGDKELASEALTAGILHDIGRLLFILADSDWFQMAYGKSQSACDLKREEEFFGLDHQAVGAELAARWNFPDRIREAIEHHHQPEKADATNVIVAAVSVADLICHALQIGDSASFYVSQFSPEAWARLKIGYDELPGILRGALKELSETQRALLAS